MSTEKKALIPASHEDPLGSTALAHVATVGPRGEVRDVVDHIEEDPDLDFINPMSKKHPVIDEYQNRRPGDERVVAFVGPEHTTKKDG